MKSKLEKLLARYQSGSISGTYYRRVKVVLLQSKPEIKF